ncbi:MAG: type II toxin-antitoxin system RelE/ParE family toxin [Alphaproteobacteria bacterium]|nr:type II toxin-antitoxin system RelE/ParE family toxin [Alphaproteobacteria bacterium]
MKTLAYSKAAIKDLWRLGPTASKRITLKIAQYARDPAALTNNVKSLQGSNYLRLRIADWRVIFTEDLQILRIVRVRHRKDAYR